MPTPLFQIKLPIDLKDRLDSYAQARSQTSTQVVRELLGAIQRGEAVVQRSDRKDAVLAMRLDKGTRNWLGRHAKDLHTSASDVVREAVQALLDDTLSTSTSLNPNPFPKDNQP